MKKLMNWLKNEESGQGMVEYGLIIVLIALVVIIGLQFLGEEVNNVMTKAGEKLKEGTGTNP